MTDSEIAEATLWEGYDMRLAMACILLPVWMVPAGASGWWDSAWSWRQRVSIDASILAHDLEQFPVSLFLENPELVAHAAKADGSDVRAVSQDGHVLPLEIVRWQPEMAELHVRVPRIVAGQAGQYVDLYCGNPAAEREPSVVFAGAGYRAVLHLAGDTQDACAGAPTVVPEGNIALGEAARFPGDAPAFLRMDPQLLEGVGGTITLGVRFRMQSGPALQTLVSGVKQENGEDWFNFGLKEPATVHTNATSRKQQAPELNPVGIRPDEWHGAVVCYDARDRTRTICIDGVVLQSDSALPGPLEVNEVRIGRGVLHFEPWQFHGDMDEFRFSAEARSRDWLRAEAACLGGKGDFAIVGPCLRPGEPAPPPGAFDLLAPDDGGEWRKRGPVELRWRPSPGAERYTVLLHHTLTDEQPVSSFDAAAATRFALDAAPLSGQTVYWTVRAENASGNQGAAARRSLTFYDWSTSVSEMPKNAVAPVLQPAEGTLFDLEGYLRGRIDRVIQRFFRDVPESSPAILQVLRDRDRTPVREPLVPWAGEFAGKYLTAAQLTWRLTHDEGLKETIDAFVRDLIACQQPSGYLGPFPEASRLTGGNWDVWGHYHCMLGLMLYHEDTGFEAALDTCRKAADLLFETFGSGGPTLTCDGSGGEMNMAVCHALVLLYKKTGVARYLDLAKYIVHEAWNEEGAGHYLECALAGKPVVEMPRHRWESIHDWQALAELYWLTGDEQYRNAFMHLWRDALRGDRHNTGGVTSGEGFQGTPYHDGAIETCCTVAWIAFSIDMLRMTGDSRVADEIEWSTLNSALGAIPYSGRVCAYNVPMDGTRTFGVELPWQSPKGGPDLNCCSVNANRPLGMIAQWALMQDADGLLLNFYGPGRFEAGLPGGNKVTLRQVTEYPVNPAVRIEITTANAEEFSLRLRIPSWSGKTAASINGEAIPAPCPGSYLRLRREWQTGDIVEITFDFSPRFWTGAESRAGKVSLYRGPLLLAYDARYNTLEPNALPALDWQAVVIEPAAWHEPIDPWFLATVRDAAGNAYAVCDLSSAGQTGNHYRSWLPAKDTASFGAAGHVGEPRVELLSLARIWDAAPHNAFTDLIRFQEKWYCSFRESEGHVGGDGKTRILVSADGETWRSATLLEEAGIDLRDPKLCVTPDGRLMCVMGGSVYRGKDFLGRQPRVSFSTDGLDWSAPERILEEGDWLWRVTWHKNRAYGITYKLFEKNQPERILELTTSEDGIRFERIAFLNVPDKPNETTLRFLDDDRMVALVRREGGDTAGWIGVSAPPYTQWDWKQTAYRLGGPNFIQTPDGRFWAGTRYYGRETGMVLCRMTLDGLEPALLLPSGGDCSYPGMVWHDGLLWMSYYASHEGKSAIYLAKMRLP